MTTFLVIAVVLLQAADGWTTYRAITRGWGHEGNRLVRGLMDRVGVFWALVILKGWAAAFIAGGYWLHWWQGDAAKIGLALLVLFYGRIVYDNSQVLRRHA